MKISKHTSTCCQTFLRRKIRSIKQPDQIDKGFSFGVFFRTQCLKFRALICDLLPLTSCMKRGKQWTVNPMWWSHGKCAMPIRIDWHTQIQIPIFLVNLSPKDFVHVLAKERSFSGHQSRNVPDGTWQRVNPCDSFNGSRWQM